MVTRTQEEIIQLLLKTANEQLSISQIAKRLKKSYSLTYNNIKAIKNILEESDLPPAKIIKISKDAPVDIIIDEERKISQKFLNTNPWIRLYLDDVLKSETFFILLAFGSYAKNLETQKSDLDLLFIIPDNTQLFQSSHYTKIKKSIIVVKTSEFIDMINNPNKFNVGNEVRMHHIILYGTEQYYNLLRKV